MFSVPHDLRGRRHRVLHDGNPLAATSAAWEAGLRGLAEAANRWPEVQYRRDAQEAWVDWLNRVKPRLGPDGDLRSLSEWSSKLTGTVARVAGLLPLAHTSSGVVTIKALRAAMRVGEYWVGHMQAVMADDQDPVVKDAVSVISDLRNADDGVLSANRIAQSHHTVWQRRAKETDAGRAPRPCSRSPGGSRAGGSFG